MGRADPEPGVAQPHPLAACDNPGRTPKRNGVGDAWTAHESGICLDREQGTRIRTLGVSTQPRKDLTTGPTLGPGDKPPGNPKAGRGGDSSSVNGRGVPSPTTGVRKTLAAGGHLARATASAEGGGSQTVSQSVRRCCVQRPEQAPAGSGKRTGGCRVPGGRGMSRKRLPEPVPGNGNVLEGIPGTS